MLTFITLGSIGPNMPAITASLSETGYEGYTSIPKGMRSKVIDRLLRDYALDRVHIYREQVGQVSVKEVLDKQEFLEMSLQTGYQELRDLKEELRDLKEARE
jgi:hypothetical protein